jgi:probable HAF family extracellular repeat protein
VSRARPLIAFAGIVACALALVGAGAVSPAASSTSAPYYYDVVELHYGNYSDAAPTGINSNGDVVGWAEKSTSNAADHAIRWHNGQGADLGPIAASEYPEYRAEAINDAGQVSGASTFSSYGAEHATLWSGGHRTDLDLGTGPSVESGGNAINNSGVVAGYRQASGTEHATTWLGAARTDLGTLAGGASEAYGINNRGEVVGRSDVTLPKFRAFLWQKSSSGSGGHMVDLGTLPGDVGAEAYAINSRSQVVGESVAADQTTRAVLWEKLVVHQLQAIAQPSDAAALNSTTQVVGTFLATVPQRCHVVPGGSDCVRHHHAFLWQNGVMSDLRKLVSPTYPWPIASYGVGINDRGQIIVDGVTRESAVDGGLYNREHVLLLTPRVHLVALTIVPATVQGGHAALGVVTLNAPAPPGGATVPLSSTFTAAIATPPGVVVVPAGDEARSFTIPTVAKAHGSGTVTASYGGTTKTATLTVVP